MELTKSKDAEEPKNLEEELDEEMLSLTQRLHGMVDADSDEYSKMVENLEKLSNIQSTTVKTKKAHGVDSNTVFNGVIAVGQIAFFSIYENRHVISATIKQFLRRV